MKNSLTFLTFTGILLFHVQLSAQGRNEEVRELNRVIELMNAFGSCNQQWYLDAVQLQKALHESTDGINKNYFYCSKTQHSGFVYYSGIEENFRFPEITPNAQKQVPAYQSDYIPWLKAKERVQQLLSDQRYNSAIIPFIQEYTASADSLFATHTDLNDYVSEKAYLSDPLFQKAEAILSNHQHWFKACYDHSLRLDSVLLQYYQTHLPPFTTHAALQNGQKELDKSMDLLAEWAATLYAEDLSENARYDAQLRLLNEEGLSKDSVYLFHTRGYGRPNSGFWLHTRYRTFYTSMKSTVYWFAASERYTPPFMKTSQRAYNDFIRSYNAIVEDYNAYIAIADGLTFANTSECCLSRSEIDTNQNVLLMKPRLLYQFEIIPVPSTQTTITAPETLSSDEALIREALPHHLVYLLDVSSSMNGAHKLDLLKENVSYLVGIQREADQISVVTFSGTSQVLLQAVPCNRKELILEKIGRISATGQTNVYEGFKTVKGLLESNRLESGINTVLILTDGEFALTSQIRAIITHLKTAGIGVSFIYLGKETPPKNKKIFRKLGIDYYDTSKTDFRKIVLKIATE